MNGYNRSNLIFVAVIILLFATMSACAKKPVAMVDQEESVQVEAATGASDSAAVKPSPMDEGKGEVESLDTQVIENTDSEPLEGRTSVGLFPLYFDFDKSIIRDDQQDRVAKNAAFMKANPGMNIRIEGNCDERGTNEYNMALGQRRALSGKQYLVNLGVVESRLDTISYGEEQPINFGHDELSWSQNRRADFVVIK